MNARIIGVGGFEVEMETLTVAEVMGEYLMTLRFSIIEILSTLVVEMWKREEGLSR